MGVSSFLKERFGEEKTKEGHWRCGELLRLKTTCTLVFQAIMATGNLKSENYSRLERALLRFVAGE